MGRRTSTRREALPYQVVTSIAEFRNETRGHLHAPVSGPAGLPCSPLRIFPFGLEMIEADVGFRAEVNLLAFRGLLPKKATEGAHELGFILERDAGHDEGERNRECGAPVAQSD